MGLFTSWKLKSSSPAARAHAARALGVAGKAANVATLAGLLDDPDPTVRTAAAESLGVIGDASAITPLSRVALDAAHGRDEAAGAVRLAAIAALGRLGAPSVPALAEVVRDRQPKVREAVVTALASVGGAPVVPALATALRDERSSIRQSAARTLGSIGGDAAERALLGALDHKDAATRAAVAQVLGSIASAKSVDALARAVSDRDKSVRESALAALGRIGHAAAIEALVSAFEGQDRDVRQAAAAALRSATWAPATPRQRAVHAVLRGDIGEAQAQGPEAVLPLVLTLADRDPVARRAAAEALGTIGDARAIDPLVSALGDPDEQVRNAAAQALVHIGPLAAPAIIDAFDTRGALVRAAALGALEAIGEARALAPLIHALTHTVRDTVQTPRSVTEHAGVETAILFGDDDVVRARGAVHTLQRMLECAAGRVPMPDLERMTALHDLAQLRQKNLNDAIARAGAPEEISCDTLRHLAALELARRRQGL